MGPDASPCGSGERQRGARGGAEGDDDERWGAPDDEQDKADQRDAEITRRVHRRGPDRIGEGRTEHSNDGGVDTPPASVWNNAPARCAASRRMSELPKVGRGRQVSVEKTSPNL